MAAVTITASSRTFLGLQDAPTRVGPTTHPRALDPTVAGGGARPRRRVSRTTYVRRRLSVAVLAVGLVLVTAQAGAALGGSSSPEAPGRAPAPAAAGLGEGTAAGLDDGTATVVRPGDSLWSLAERLAPGSDPRPVVDALREARHGRTLLVGETVRWDG